jgi:GT2 family glycosyltransferase
MIDIVTATRLSSDDFWSQSALGASLKRLAEGRRFSVQVATENRRALPDIYNTVIAASQAEHLVFVHDDVWIDDIFFADRIEQGLAEFDVLGIAGNRRRLPGQPSWAFATAQMQWDERSNLSGAVGHGAGSFGPVSRYGAAPAACELLDGVLLAARRSTLLQHGVRFDPRFDFHFYDLDFCRSARQAGLRLGTWPISLTHQSGGAFGTAQWQLKYRDYLAKWGD